MITLYRSYCTCPMGFQSPKWNISSVQLFIFHPQVTLTALTHSFPKTLSTTHISWNQLTRSLRKMPQRLAIVSSILLYSGSQHPLLCKEAQSDQSKITLPDAITDLVIAVNELKKFQKNRISGNVAWSPFVAAKWAKSCTPRSVYRGWN